MRPHGEQNPLVLHNFLALFGVTSALAEAGQLGTYQEPVVPLLVTALVSLIVLVDMERTLIPFSDGVVSGVIEG